MRELTELEIQWLLSLRDDLMNDGHEKSNLKAECISQLEAIKKITKVIRGEE